MTQSPPVENKTNHEVAIRELIDRFAKAFRAKDINGVMSVFAPEIISFDILPPLQAVGAETFVKHWREFFESFQGAIQVEFPDVCITAGDDVEFSYCLHQVKGTLTNGKQTDWWLRWTACYRNCNGEWLIVHEQVSVPVDLGNGKAMLDLKP
jgi:ketosteroid isomerase-like protein